jgi:hypothetical protein
MKDREHFTHRTDMWDADGTKVIEHLANVEDFEVAMATYHAACASLAYGPHHPAAGWACDCGTGPARFNDVDGSIE